MLDKSSAGDENRRSIMRCDRTSDMQLSAEELARLEEMFSSGIVRSDPSTLSATDRMLDDLTRVARKRTTHRTSRSRLTAMGRKFSLNSSAPSDLNLAWNIPRTLDELIQVRKVLLR